LVVHPGEDIMPGQVPITATPLPGIGTQYKLTTAGGRAVSVVAARDGRRSLAFYDIDDPDSCGPGVRLTPAEAAKLAELLIEPAE
jgi:TrkA domain protein